MKAYEKELKILEKLINKYFEENDKKRVLDVILKNGFPIKYIANEFSILKIPSKMSKEDLKEYQDNILIYI